MGLNLATCQFLLEARTQGTCFRRTLTLGHQHMSVGPKRLARLLTDYGINPAPGIIEELHNLAPSHRASAFLKALGAEHVEALDASAYEGADRIHDLNQPIPADWKAQYDVVLDAGTLEHVFSFPVAMKNVMELVRQGGHLICVTPYNNMAGHGFYQFSPELFFRTLNAANGYETRTVVAMELDEPNDSFLGLCYPFRVQGAAYTVRDPIEIHGRVELINSRPTFLLVRAQRTSVVEPFAQAPQQSDYCPLWEKSEAPKLTQKSAAAGKRATWLQGLFGEDTCREILAPTLGLINPLRWWRYRRSKSLANHNSYEERKWGPNK